jgi:uncharacterized phage-associated protein
MFLFFFNDERIDARTLANYIIQIATSTGSKINNMKLQKILYYVQGHYLARFGHPLFPEEIHAWAFGPAVPDVYYTFSRFGSASLHVLDMPDMSSLLEEEMEFVDQVIRSKLAFSMMDLSNATRKESPWLNATDNGRTIRQFQVIPLESLKDFFKQKE